MAKTKVGKVLNWIFNPVGALVDKVTEKKAEKKGDDYNGSLIGSPNTSPVSQGGPNGSVVDDVQISSPAVPDVSPAVPDVSPAVPEVKPPITVSDPIFDYYKYGAFTGNFRGRDGVYSDYDKDIFGLYKDALGYEYDANLNNANLANQTAINNANLANQTAINEANIASNESINQANLDNQNFINQQMLDFQREANQQNLDFQREQFEYQKWLNANQMTLAYQDMARNGINPLAGNAMGMSGTSFSGGASGVSLGQTQLIPNNSVASADFRSANLRNGVSSISPSGGINPIEVGLKGIDTIVSILSKRGSLDVSRYNAETDRINAYANAVDKGVNLSSSILPKHHGIGQISASEDPYNGTTFKKSSSRLLDHAMREYYESLSDLNNQEYQQKEILFPGQIKIQKAQLEEIKSRVIENLDSANLKEAEVIKISEDIKNNCEQLALNHISVTNNAIDVMCRGYLAIDEHKARLEEIKKLKGDQEYQKYAIELLQKEVGAKNFETYIKPFLLKMLPDINLNANAVQHFPSP